MLRHTWIVFALACHLVGRSVGQERLNSGKVCSSGVEPLAEVPEGCVARVYVVDGCLQRKPLCQNAKCGTNEELHCGGLCEASCMQPNVSACALTECANYHCDCRQGYVRNSQALCVQPLFCNLRRQWECFNDVDCETGFLCAKNNRCVKPHLDKTCVRDGDCEGSDICARGRCSNFPTMATSPAVEATCSQTDCDIQPRSSCISGKCQIELEAMAMTDVCTVDGDCDMSSVCDLNTAEGERKMTGVCQTKGLDDLTMAAMKGVMPDCVRHPFHRFCRHNRFVCRPRVGFCPDHAMTECFRDRDCHQGEQCRRGHCRDRMNECMHNSDCSVGKECSRRRCLPRKDTCSRDRDCRRGEFCRDARCKPTECFEDRRCRPGEICVHGRCSDERLRNNLNFMCETNADCDMGGHCNNVTALCMIPTVQQVIDQQLLQTDCNVENAKCCLHPDRNDFIAKDSEAISFNPAGTLSPPGTEIDISCSNTDHALSLSFNHDITVHLTRITPPRLRVKCNADALWTTSSDEHSVPLGSSLTISCKPPPVMIDCNLDSRNCCLFAPEFFLPETHSISVVPLPSMGKSSPPGTKVTLSCSNMANSLLFSLNHETLVHFNRVSPPTLVITCNDNGLWTAMDKGQTPALGSSLSIKCQSPSMGMAAGCNDEMMCALTDACVDGRCVTRSMADVQVDVSTDGSRLCEIDDDCPGQCEAGVCVDTAVLFDVSCMVDGQCRPGQMCISRKCRDQDNECFKDEDCRSEQFCSRKRCVRRSLNCARDMDCRRGQMCSSDSMCVKISCRRSSDCDTGLDCFRGRCVNPNNNPGASVRCKVSVDCGQETTCMNGFCAVMVSQNGDVIEKISCAVNSECQSGQVCVNNFCSQNMIAGSSNLKCEKTETDCPVDETCSNGLCQLTLAAQTEMIVTAGGQCATTVECAMNNVCQGGNCIAIAVTELFPPMDLTGSGAICTQNSNCVAGQMCMEMRCIKQPVLATVTESAKNCSRKTDCGSGEGCTGEMCVTPIDTQMKMVADGQMPLIRCLTTSDCTSHKGPNWFCERDLRRCFQNRVVAVHDSTINTIGPMTCSMTQNCEDGLCLNGICVR